MTDLRKAAEMALEALDGLQTWSNGWLKFTDEIQALRQALAQPDKVLAEREACALICENMERNGAWITKTEAAAAIRARGKK